MFRLKGTTTSISSISSVEITKRLFRLVCLWNRQTSLLYLESFQSGRGTGDIEQKDTDWNSDMRMTISLLFKQRDTFR